MQLRSRANADVTTASPALLRPGGENEEMRDPMPVNRGPRTHPAAATEIIRRTQKATPCRNPGLDDKESLDEQMKMKGVSSMDREHHLKPEGDLST
ncbi:hypothetical protein NDU88_010110 [Pleurodeles waltl]|uniref:Uncharacterized protein n=1 Tax=Pleurodeles waltl TaxID=8319 RepID=A0AAV7PXA8_PLEWA|nr:hypothetical protein NDU88_010110 [Pleurodeles waltl]